MNKNSYFNSIQTTQTNHQEEDNHHFIYSDLNKKFLNFPKNSNRNLIIFILFISLSTLTCMIFYLNSHISQLQTKIQKQQQVNNYLARQNEYKKFFKSWKNSENNNKNLIKINKIKQLTKSQEEYFKEDPKRMQAFLLVINNYPLSYMNNTLQKQVAQNQNNQNERMQNIYDFNLPQLPFCIMVCTVNNSKDSRYEHNLRSILNQNYTNYKVVIIDDASKDQTPFLIQQLIQEISPPQKIHLIRNQKNTAKLSNIYKAAHQYCQQNDIGFTVDGDDQLLGVNVFKVFNHEYQKGNLSFAYSNAIRTWNDQKLIAGYGQSYSPIQKQNLNYRSTRGSKVFNLVSFKISNFRKIKLQDFKDSSGQWFKCAADQVMWPPLMELSCGKQLFINEYFYFNYKGLGNQNMQVHPQCNQKVKQTIGTRPKYPCAN